MPVTYCDVFSFLWRSIQTMTRFFDCFCVRQIRPRHRSQNVPNSSPYLPKEEVGEKIRLSSLFTAADKEESIVAERENLVQSRVDEELLKEARFLKASGTLPETPAEIRKAVSFTAKLEKSDEQRPNSDVNSSPNTPDVIKEDESLSKNLESSGLYVPPSALETSLGTPEETQIAETSAANLEDSDLQRTCNVLKSSPYPTPRNLTDDMQTPGTVFATNMTDLAKGNVRIRSQYVHTTLNPIEDQGQQQDLKQENSVLNEPPDPKGEHLSEQESATPSSSVPLGGGDSNKDDKVEVSLSAWLKPPRAYNDAARYRKTNTKRTLGDRPIIGLVGTHWKEEDETSHITPKWWDGNGIPNSTTKYKEDQKVCWHATPFEERLEKALSEETSVSQRKSITGAPIMFEEMEGHDTATSQLQPMNCAKSVVSF